MCIEAKKRSAFRFKVLPFVNRPSKTAGQRQIIRPVDHPAADLQSKGPVAAIDSRHDVGELHVSMHRTQSSRGLLATVFAEAAKKNQLRNRIGFCSNLHFVRKVFSFQLKSFSYSVPKLVRFWS